MTAFDPPANVDIAIVGAGPVGLMLALLLGVRGVNVAVFERWESPYPLPRAVGLSHDSLRMLQSAGVLDALSDLLVIEQRDRVGAFLDAQGQLLFANNRYPGAAASGFPAMNEFNQPDFEPALEACCARLSDVAVHRGWEIQDAAKREGGVELTLASTRGGVADGAAHELRARFVVGCDGANSLIRARMGSGVIDTGFASSWLVIDLKPTAPWTSVREVAQILDPARPTSLLPAGPGRRRFEMMVMPGDSAAELTDPATVWRLLARYDVHPGNAELVRQAVYTFRGCWADDWRRGPMLIAGDAAHLMPPFLAQGVNSGLRDAAALAWRLTMILSGDASDSILDSYTTERLPHVRQIIDQAVARGRMICVSDPDEAAARDALLRRWQADPSMIPTPSEWRLGPGLLMPDDPHAGLLGVQGRVGIGDRIGLFDDVFGGGHFVLIGDGIDPLDDTAAETQETWRRLDGVAVTIGHAVRDPDQTYRRWFDTLAVPIVLVRPDFAIYGVATGPTGVDGLLATLRDQLRLA